MPYTVGGGGGYPPAQTKVTIVGKHEVYYWEIWSGQFSVHKVLGPRPPLSLPPPLLILPWQHGAACRAGHLGCSAYEYEHPNILVFFLGLAVTRPECSGGLRCRMWTPSAAAFLPLFRLENVSKNSRQMTAPDAPAVHNAVRAVSLQCTRLPTPRAPAPSPKRAKGAWKCCAPPTRTTGAAGTPRRCVSCPTSVLVSTLQLHCDGKASMGSVAGAGVGGTPRGKSTCQPRFTRTRRGTS